MGKANDRQRAEMRQRLQRRPLGRNGNTGAQQSMRNSRQYFYVRSHAQRGSTGDMMPILLGPYNDFQSAQDVGMTKVHRQFDIVALPTRDLAQASRMLKATILQESSDIDHSLRRLKHTFKRS